MDLCYYGETVLRKSAETVTTFDEELNDFANEMIETMHENEGVGLAAPQVGRGIRLIVVDISRGDEPSNAYVLVNPEIVEESSESEIDEEGCLSLPSISLKIKRAHSITVRAQNTRGEEMTVDAEGFLARVLQHEIDHINGILMIDHVSPVQRTLLRNKLKKITTGEVFDDDD